MHGRTVARYTPEGDGTPDLPPARFARSRL